MTAVTCHTEGCLNAEIPIDLDLTWEDDEGETHNVDAVVCGVCGQPITDIAGYSS